jgi:glycosyltransferase involved in cell wall biosynthesis
MPHGSLTKYDQNHHKFRKILFNFIFLKMYLKNAKKIFVASKIEAIEIAAGFPNTEVAVVGLGFPKQEAKALIHFEMNSLMPIFLFMGRITRKKRLDLTILAFAKFNSKFPGSKLIVAGDGALRDTRILRDLVDDLDLAHLIDFRGWLFGNDKINALNDSDFFILNSEDENFAVIVPEVQQLGIPALVSRAVAYSEVVSKYSSGVVIEDLTIESIVTGMEKLVGHKYSELALNALAGSKSVEWRIVIDKWVAEIRSLSALETYS